MIVKLHHGQVSIPKGGEQQARAFYCGLLGFREIEKPENLKTRGGLWAEIGDVQIHFGAEDGFDRRSTRAHLAYQVKGLAEWREKLQAAGAEVLEGSPIPGFERFEFRDPFGNRVEFLEAVEI